MLRAIGRRAGMRLLIYERDEPVPLIQAALSSNESKLLRRSLVRTLGRHSRRP